MPGAPAGFMFTRVTSLTSTAKVVHAFVRLPIRDLIEPDPTARAPSNRHAAPRVKRPRGSSSPMRSRQRPARGAGSAQLGIDSPVEAHARHQRVSPRSPRRGPGEVSRDTAGRLRASRKCCDASQAGRARVPKPRPGDGARQRKLGTRLGDLLHAAIKLPTQHGQLAFLNGVGTACAQLVGGLIEIAAQRACAVPQARVWPRAPARVPASWALRRRAKGRTPAVE